MPIEIDEFERLSGDEDTIVLQEGTNAHRVVSFLREHPDKAFRQGEIAEATEVKRGSISVVLSRLEDQGLVRHRDQYWALAEDDRVGAVEAMAHGFEAATAYDAPDKDAWDEHAVESADDQ